MNDTIRNLEMNSSAMLEEKSKLDEQFEVS